MFDLFYRFLLTFLFKGKVTMVFQVLDADLFPELFHGLDDILVQLVEFVLIQVIRLRFTIRSTLRKLITFMTFLHLFASFLNFLFLDFFDHVSGLLWHVAEWLFFVTLSIYVFLFGSKSWILYFPGLKIVFIAWLSLVLFFALNSVGFEHLHFGHLLLSL